MKRKVPSLITHKYSTLVFKQRCCKVSKGTCLGVPFHIICEEFRKTWKGGKKREERETKKNGHTAVSISLQSDVLDYMIERRASPDLRPSLREMWLLLHLDLLDIAIWCPRRLTWEDEWLQYVRAEKHCLQITLGNISGGNGSEKKRDCKEWMQFYSWAML